jgi:hypothetical protein
LTTEQFWTLCAKKEIFVSVENTTTIPRSSSPATVRFIDREVFACQSETRYTETVQRKTLAHTELQEVSTYIAILNPLGLNPGAIRLSE